MKKLPVLIACLAALALLASGCGTTTTYAAAIDGKEISQKELTDELIAIRNNKKYAEDVEQQLAQGGGKLRGSGKNTFDATFTSRVLTRQIFLKIVHDGFVEKKLTISPEVRKEAEENQVQQFEQQFKGDKTVWEAFPVSYRNVLITRSAEIEVLQKELSKSGDEKAVAEYYEKNKSEFLETCSRHILASFPGDPRDPNNPPPAPDVDAATRAKAQVWKDRIVKGEDFAAIAKAESGDTGSGAQGGDLGCRGGFVEEFTTAMEQLQPGQTSDPVKTQFGYHVIQVTSRKQLSLEDARDRIEQQLQQEGQNAVQTFLTERLEKAKIKINPKYGTWDKGDPAQQRQPQVIPPKGPTTTTTRGPGDNEGEVTPGDELPEAPAGGGGGGGAGGGGGSDGGGGG